MHQRVQYADGRLAKATIQWLKELEAGIMQEIDKFQSSLAQDECCKMQKLESEGRYAELYLYAKSLPADDAGSKAKTGELKECLMKVLNIASSGLEKMRGEIAARTTVSQYRTVFDSYKKGEVFTLDDTTCAGEKGIVSALKNADMSKFKAVYLYSGFSVEDLVASELASRLQASPVSALYIGGLGISDAGAATLAQAAFRGESLSAFCIWSSIISDKGAKAVAEAARNCRSLTTLYLDGNQISDCGAKAVAEAVKGCPLSVFHIGGGEISDFGAIAVAKAVKDHPLSVFYLLSRDGNISDVGAIAVTRAVKDCPLSVFSLVSDGISDTGATAVAAEMVSGKCARTLSAFHLSSFNISDLGAKHVADAIKSCPLLSSFYLFNYQMSGETLAYILKDMAGSSTIIRSVSLCVGSISKEQMDSCMDQLQQSGAGKQLKLRFECEYGFKLDESAREKVAVKWNGKFAEFRFVHSIRRLFEEETILGVPQ